MYVDMVIENEDESKYIINYSKFIFPNLVRHPAASQRCLRAETTFVCFCFAMSLFGFSGIRKNKH